jgi:hypothetical protein
MGRRLRRSEHRESEGLAAPEVKVSTKEQSSGHEVGARVPTLEATLMLCDPNMNRNPRGFSFLVLKAFMWLGADGPCLES